MSRSNFVTFVIIALMIVFTAAEIRAQTDAQFLNTWANEARKGLNTRLGEAELTAVTTYCASGCQSYNQTSFLGVWIKMWRYSKNNISIAQSASSVKPALVTGYCASGALQRNLGVTVSVNDMYNQYLGDFYIQPSDCVASSASSGNNATIQATSPDAQTLTTWAALTRKDLPAVLGSVQFTEATTYCTTGCQVTAGQSYLSLKAWTPGLAKQSISLNQLGQTVRPTIVAQYCSTARDAVARNIGLLGALYDMNQSYVGTLFWITASDCAKLASQNTSVTPSVGNSSGNSTNSGANSNQVEDQYWNAVSGSTRVQDFQGYLNNYPNGRYAAVARLKIGQLGGSPTGSASGSFSSPSTITSANSSVEDQYWNAVSASNNAQDFQSYLNNYPNGKYVTIARLKISQLGGTVGSGGQPTFGNPTVGSSSSFGNTTVEQQYWDAMKNSSNSADFQRYLQDYPNGQFVPIARLKISQLGSSTPSGQVGGLSAEDQYWNAVSGSQRVQDYQGYLYNYPNGKYVALANLRISQLGGIQIQTNVSVSAVEDQYWNNIRNSQNSQDFQSYLNAYPNGQYAMIARLRISQLNASGVPNPTLSTNCVPYIASKQRGADILAKAQFGSINDMKPLRRYWIITESGDLESKKIITDEVTKEYPQLTAASREEDAEFYMIFAMADNAGNTVINTYGTINNTITGEFLVFTSTPGANCLPNIKILFRTSKTQTFSQAGITFNRHPATNASREFVKALKKANF